MSTIVLLSSSPTRIFARSPTPVGSSSPSLPNATALLKDDSPGGRKFKTIATVRDGFPTTSVSARTVLAVKNGAENKPVTSPSKTRFRSSQSDTAKVAQPKFQRTNSKEDQLRSIDESIVDDTSPLPITAQPVVVQITTKDVRRNKKRAQSPLRLQKATPRRTDWTPPKPTVPAPDVEQSANETPAFPNDLNRSFGYEGARAGTACYDTEVAQSVKRRKLDTLPANAPNLVFSKTTPAPKKSTISKPSVKRTKSPTKKPLTITGLATANFVVPDEPESQPLTMLDYLTGSQIQTDSTSDQGELNDKVSKTKEAVKKLRAGKITVKSLLRSPTTALKSFGEQEAIFGSASQLARSESPTFLRDTIEALKQSESNILSDPISPPRATQIPSSEVTPQIGTARFRRSRNLWAAAGRDDGNALMHVECVDLTDTPAIRNAFAGKDVLVQQGTRRSTSPVKQMPNLRGDGGSGLLGTSTILDIDDIVTPIKGPSLQQTNAMHTSAAPTSGAAQNIEHILTAIPLAPDSAPVAKKSTKPRKSRVKKPHYGGLTDNELRKQISAYGFKVIKSREKMVDLLERCWIEKHGKDVEPASDPVPEPDPPIPLNREGSGFGDILSNVHDITARPVPKVKKVKAPRKKEADNGEPAVKKPRAPRKKKEEALDENGQPVKKARAPRKKKDAAEAASKKTTPKETASTKKAQTSTLSTEPITPDDDLVDIPVAEPDLHHSNAVAPMAIETAIPADDVEPPPSPPTTCPSSPETPLAKSKTPKATASTTSPTKNRRSSTTTPPDTDTSQLDTKITAAILHEITSLTTRTSSSNPVIKRNHALTPTWHEKILLYDPIVLEDLALWLNTTGLSAVSEDTEISALDVRSWCERRGICCLWRGGWRGNHRDKEGSGGKNSASAGGGAAD